MRTASPTGFEYCLAANIARRVGLDQVEVVNIAWPGTAAGAAFWDAVLGAQDLAFDLALSEISITPERARQVTFSVPYYRTDIGVMAKADREVDLAGIRGLRIGVQAGTPAPSMSPTSFAPTGRREVSATHPPSSRRCRAASSTSP